jgi:hypothetical protein
VGYTAVDVDRAGRLAWYYAARAVALADPRNLALLCAGSFSTGFPLEMREFLLAFQAVPALPSRILPAAARDPEVVVREIPTDCHGTYYLVVNPTWTPKSGVQIQFPVLGPVTNLVTGQSTRSGSLDLTMPAASLHAFHTVP